MLNTLNMNRKPLDEIETFQHNYGIDTNDVELWLNEGTSGFTAEIFGWQQMLLIKHNGLDVLTLGPSEWLIRDAAGRLHRLNNELMESFFEPA